VKTLNVKGNNTVALAAHPVRGLPRSDSPDVPSPHIPSRPAPQPPAPQATRCSPPPGARPGVLGTLAGKRRHGYSGSRPSTASCQAAPKAAGSSRSGAYPDEDEAKRKLGMVKIKAIEAVVRRRSFTERPSRTHHVLSCPLCRANKDQAEAVCSYLKRTTSMRFAIKNNIDRNGKRLTGNQEPSSRVTSCVGVSSDGAEKNVLAHSHGPQDTSTPLGRDASFFMREPMRAADLVGVRTRLQAKDLISLLLRHFARNPKTSRPPRCRTTLHVVTPAGLPAVRVSPSVGAASSSMVGRKPVRSRRSSAVERDALIGPARCARASPGVVIELHLDEGRADLRRLPGTLLRALEQASGAKAASREASAGKAEGSETEQPARRQEPAAASAPIPPAVSRPAQHARIDVLKYLLATQEQRERHKRREKRRHYCLICRSA